MVEENIKPNLSDVLVHCELFVSLTQSERELIAAGCEQRTITDGTVLITEGNSGNEMYVLIDGVLEVFKQTDGKDVILQRHEKTGSHIGEGALLGSGDDIRRGPERRTWV